MRLFQTIYRVHAVYLTVTVLALAVTIGVAATTHSAALLPVITQLGAGFIAGFVTLSLTAAADLRLTH
ncbi:hypothetical protein ACIRCZ_18545 [Leifsonia sp. NPDC102414]|uniref:hypothetical protein n=1 Tax=Leifsonia sp. NPDC102414 TaxID=3364124 RepID=UPI00381715B3